MAEHESWKLTKDDLVVERIRESIRQLIRRDHPKLSNPTQNDEQRSEQNSS